MSSETCGYCGKNPAEEYAAIDGERYCHGDGFYPTCFMQAQWDFTLICSQFLRGFRTGLDRAAAELERRERETAHLTPCRECGELTTRRRYCPDCDPRDDGDGK